MILVLQQNFSVCTENTWNWSDVSERTLRISRFFFFCAIKMRSSWTCDAFDLKKIDVIQNMQNIWQPVAPVGRRVPTLWTAGRRIYSKSRNFLNSDTSNAWCRQEFDSALPFMCSGYINLYTQHSKIQSETSSQRFHSTVHRFKTGWEPLTNKKNQQTSRLMVDF